MTTRVVKRQNPRTVVTRRVNKPKRQRNVRNNYLNQKNLFSQYKMSSIPSNTPKINSSGKGSIIIKNSEYFDTITAADANFHILTYPIQPGLGVTFPWLSTIANSYDGYRVLKMSFEFKTNSGSANTGHIIQAIDYDAKDDIPTNEGQLTQNYGSVPHSIWEPNSTVTYDVSKNGFYNKHYTRAGTISSNSDIKTYDSGNFLFGYMSGTNINIGMLWVHYEIELYNPQPGVIPGGSIALGPTQGVSAVASVGTNWNGILSNPEAYPFVRTSDTTVTFTTPFSGLVVWRAVGTVITNLAIATTCAYSVNTFVPFFDAGALNGDDMIIVRAEVGDTLTFTPTATTITHSNLFAFSSRPLQTVL